jgi:hypothetical protein
MYVIGSRATDSFVCGNKRHGVTSSVLVSDYMTSTITRLRKSTGTKLDIYCQQCIRLVIGVEPVVVALRRTAGFPASLAIARLDSIATRRLLYCARTAIDGYEPLAGRCIEFF